MCLYVSLPYLGLSHFQKSGYFLGHLKNKIGARKWLYVGILRTRQYQARLGRSVTVDIKAESVLRYAHGDM